MSKRIFLGALVMVGCSLVISSNTEATQTVKITIPYTDQEVAGKNENNLKIFKFDVGSQTWIALPSTPHPSENYVEAEVDSFGDKYAVAEVESPPAKTEFLYMTLNPVDVGQTTAWVFNLSQRSYVTIRIYSPNGKTELRNIIYTTLDAGKYSVSWTVDVYPEVYDLFPYQIKLGSLIETHVLLVFDK